MTHIVSIKGGEFWDQDNQVFRIVEDATLVLEHSLIAMSKWESMYEVPLLENYNKSDQHSLDYIKCMVINSKELKPDTLFALTQKQIEDIDRYIQKEQTATVFSVNGEVSPSRNNGSFVTSELVYYWMIAHGIPFTCEKWPLKRLLTLIRICNIKAEEANGKKRSMSQREIMEQNRALNEARKQQYKTKG